MAKKAYIGVPDGTGKNLLNMNYAAFNADIYSVTKNNALAAAQANAQYKENTQYTLSWSTTAPADSVASAFFLFEYTDGTKGGYLAIINMSSNPPILPGSKQAVSAAQKTLKTVTFVAGVNGEFLLEYIQLEEGDTFTGYEPYGSGAGVARKIKKGYVGVENFAPRALPSGYTQVEYIRSSGTQYIDTGFMPKYNSRVVVDISDIGNSDYLFGTRDTKSGTSEKQFGVYRSNANTVRADYFGTNVKLTIDNTTPRTIVERNANVVKLYDSTITNTAVSSGECSYPLYIFALNDCGEALTPTSSYKLYSCQIYDNGTIVRDFVPCVNPSGVAGLYDVLNSKFYANVGSGTFAVGAAHGSVSRLIKKAYIGIGGVARPCWSGGELAYYGRITPLSLARFELAATSIGDYGVFAGGEENNSNYAVAVDAYNSNLTRFAPYNLAEGKTALTATSIGNYALFGGGKMPWGASGSVEAYNASLTKKTSMHDLSAARCYLAATSVGDYAIFAGGSTKDGGQYGQYAYVDYYNSSLTVRDSAKALSVARSDLAATTVGNYAIFAGGFDGYNPTSAVDFYTNSLTGGTADALAEARQMLAATTVGNYALFAGGHFSGTTYSTKVDAYNSSLTRTIPTALSVARGDIGATTVGKYAIFAGGDSYTNPFRFATVDVYDDKLTRTTNLKLSIPKWLHAATTVGNYALFGGGIHEATQATYTHSDVVEVFTADE